jgi:hypothetical protein
MVGVATSVKHFGFKMGSYGLITRSTPNVPLLDTFINNFGRSLITNGGTNSVESWWAQIKRAIWATYNTMPEQNSDCFIQEIL